jgi:hypothetical protein
MITIRPLQKPSWRSGVVKRLHRISPKDWRDLIFVVFLFLLQVSLVVAGVMYAS